MKVKIAILGYYGFGNLGDELVLNGVINQIQDRYPDSELTVLSANPAQTRHRHSVESISRWDLIDVLAAIWKSDFFVVGGGGLLQNNTSHRSLFYYLGLIGLARVLACPVVLYAVGVEGIRGFIPQFLCRFLLNNKKVVVTVRDEESKNILGKIGVNLEKITVTADPVFLLPASNDLLMDRNGSESVLLVPRYPCPANGRRLYAGIKKYLKCHTSMSLRCILFHPSVEEKLIKNNLELDFNLLDSDFDKNINAENAVSMISNFDLVVSARFHALVLAVLTRKPFIGIGGFSKVGRLCKWFDRPYLPWNASDQEIMDAFEKNRIGSIVGFSDKLKIAKTAAIHSVHFVG